MVNILHFENIIIIGIVMWKNLHFSETAFALRFSKIVKSNGAQCSKNYKILHINITTTFNKFLDKNFSSPLRIHKKELSQF